MSRILEVLLRVHNTRNMPPMPYNKTVKISILMLFLMLLLVQNTLALIFAGTFHGLGVSLLFYLKELFIVVMFFLTLLVNRKYKFDVVDNLAMVIFIFTLILCVFSFNNIATTLYRLKFYLGPLILFFIGRYYFSNISFNNIQVLFVITSFIILCYSYLYLFIDRSQLLNLNITDVFVSKGQDPNLLSLNDGFPINFDSYYEGKEFHRAFGLFLDPLAMGFFLVPYLFYYRYESICKRRPYDYLVYFLLFLLLLLTQTRAIILSYMFACIAVRIRKGTPRILSSKIIVLCVLSIIVTIIALYKVIIDYADPSTWGHLIAYANIIKNYANIDSINLIFGSGYSEETAFGNESIFTTMITHNGLIYFILFNTFIYRAYNIMKNNIHLKLNLITISSLIVYYLASFTTEHWFATTSSAVFWILLGMSFPSNIFERRDAPAQLLVSTQ